MPGADGSLELAIIKSKNSETGWQPPETRTEQERLSSNTEKFMAWWPTGFRLVKPLVNIFLLLQALGMWRYVIATVGNSHNTHSAPHKLGSQHTLTSADAYRARLPRLESPSLCPWVPVCLQEFAVVQGTTHVLLSAVAVATPIRIRPGARFLKVSRFLVTDFFFGSKYSPYSSFLYYCSWSYPSAAARE